MAIPYQVKLVRTDATRTESGKGICCAWSAVHLREKQKLWRWCQSLIP